LIQPDRSKRPAIRIFRLNHPTPIPAAPSHRPECHQFAFRVRHQLRARTNQPPCNAAIRWMVR
jgi:hypothetical protein